MVLRTRAILLSETGKILLVKIKGMAHFSLPGGKVDDNETTQDALHRELHEELGLTSLTTHLRFIVELPHINSFETYYVARVSDDVIHLPKTAHFFDELEDIHFFDLHTDTKYYPEWLKDRTVADICDTRVEYLGVLN